ncbi:MAG: response regulator [Mariprofundaceae bacterium]
MKFALISLVLMFAGVMSVAIVSYQESDDLLQEQAVDSVSFTLEKELINLERNFLLIKEDVAFLSALPVTARIGRALGSEDNDGLKESMKQLASLFEGLLQQRDTYYQIRLIGIDHGGKEMVSVVNQQGRVVTISDEKLQKKGTRDYFQEAIKLKRGEFNLSKLTLNREYGEITQPPMPMLRISTPLYDNQEQLYGILLINAGLDVIAASLHHTEDQLFFFVTNSAGEYLLHPDEGKAMAFEHQKNARVQDDYLLPKGLLDRYKLIIEGESNDQFIYKDRGVALLLDHLHVDALHGHQFIVGVEIGLKKLQEKSLALRDEVLKRIVVIVLLLAFVSMLVARYLTRPIQRLTEAADLISAGEYDVVIPVTGHDEIGQLGRSFELMLKKLMVSHHSLEDEVQQRTHELEEAHEAIRKKNLDLMNAVDRAEEAVGSKSLFLATMSHEIRTPLNGVLGLTELLLDSELSPQQRENLDTVHRCGETLLTILNDILDFSKMEAGQLDLSYIEFNPNRIVEQVTRLFVMQAHKKGLELIGDGIPDLSTYFIGDADRLHQILMNLLSNAVKFTEQGEVVLSVDKVCQSEEKMTLRFAVRDSGAGISETDILDLFEEFSQVDNSHTRKHGGTGLGLAIVKQLVQLMGGTINVESRVGEGSTFSFEITLEQGAELMDAAHHHVELLQQWRALIVDDNETNRKMLHQMLEAWGMQSDMVSGAEDALLQMKKMADHGQPYQIALIDHQMPDVDGMELTRRIGAMPALSDVKIIMLSSLDTSFDVHKKKQYGLDAFLRKPVHIEPLFETVLQVMDASAKEASIQESSRRISCQRSEHILLAEDNLVNQQVALGMLKNQGFEHVDVANHGVEAILLFSENSYDLVLMDIQMPELDGHAASIEIREMERNMGVETPVPLIALTAHALPEDRRKSMEVGMSDHLTKPLTGSALRALMELWLPLQANHTSDVVIDQSDAMRVGDQGDIVGERDVTNPAISRVVVRQLYNDMGMGIGLVIDAYHDELSSQVILIAQAIERGEFDAVCKLAHRLKGASLNMGANALAEICKELESMADSGDMSALAEKKVLFLQEVERVELALEDTWLEEVR